MYRQLSPLRSPATRLQRHTDMLIGQIAPRGNKRHVAIPPADAKLSDTIPIGWAIIISSKYKLASSGPDDVADAACCQPSPWRIWHEAFQPRSTMRAIRSYELRYGDGKRFWQPAQAAATQPAEAPITSRSMTRPQPERALRQQATKLGIRLGQRR